DSFCAELCEEVTGMPEGQALIERIGRANLFLVPLDAERRWFRFHALAGQFLRNEQPRAYGESVPELHRRASRWLASHDRAVTAAEHALASGDDALAAEIMTQCATRLLHEGRIVTLLRWTEAIPAKRLAQHPALHFQVALANVVAHRHEPARRLIDALEGSQARRDLAMLRFNLAIWSDRLQDLREALDQAVALLSTADGFVYASMLN